MDLLKNLQNLALDDKKKDNHASQPTATTTAPAAPSFQHQSSTDKLFSKLGDALGGSHTTTAPAPAPAATPSYQHQSSTDKLFSKLGDALSGSGSHTSAPAPAPAPAPVPEKHGADKLLSMLGDTLSGKPATPPAATPAVKKDDGILGKIGDALSGRKTPPPPPKEEGLLGKLSSAISGKPQQTPPGPAGHPSFTDKINAAFGGGAKGEAEEDKLDKAIDLFQEHVLKEGPQNNESALEQAKDKKIADAIRNAVGIPKK